MLEFGAARVTGSVGSAARESAIGRPTGSSESGLVYDWTMGDRGRTAAPDESARRELDERADVDAPWRPTRTAVVELDRPLTPDRHRDTRRPTTATGEDLGRRDTGSPVSPWSREAVESPLPTIEQIRRRWRHELGLDQGDTVDGRIGPSGEVAGARSSHPSHAGAARRASASADVPRSTMSGDLILIGLVVALVVAGALAVAWTLIPESSPTTVATPTLPSGADEAWAVDVGADAAVVAAGGGMLVAATEEGLTAYDADDGARLWEHRTDGGRPVGVAVYDEAVILVETTARTVATLTGLDREGNVAWSRSGPSLTVDLLPDRPVEHSRADAVARVGVLDPATGDVVGRPAEAVESATPEHYVVGRRDGELSVFDMRAGRWVDPAVGEFGLRTLVPVGEHVVALTDTSDIIVYDRTGKTLDQRTFVSDAFGDFTGRAELVGGVPGSDIGIVASGTSIGFDVSTGSIEVVWEVPGRVGTPVETLVGPVSVARVVDAETGEVDHSLVGAETGETMVVTDHGVTREAPPTIAANGYLAAPAVGDPSRLIAAHDFDGAQRWSLPLPAGAEYRLDDGALFVIDGQTVVAYR